MGKCMSSQEKDVLPQEPPVSPLKSDSQSAVIEKNLLMRQVLPSFATPVHYNVQIQPNLVSFAFTGRTVIQLDIHSSTKSIKLNANQLVVKNCVIVVENARFSSESISYDEEDQTVLFTFSTLIEKGKASIEIDFEGFHNDELAGFYRSAYTDENGSKKHLVVTQFEATDARRCFPCFDEPAQKATFDCILIVEPHLTALSNMNVISSSVKDHDGKQLKTVIFATTPIMSTYLLAFAVGEFEKISSVARPKKPTGAKEIEVGVYTLPGQSEQGRFSLDVCVKVLEFFSEYFNEAYPLPKCDMIAIPDFGAGAMENWGLITYRTVLLLFDPKTTSNSAKQRIAYVVSHELAHQWFGNLVTMSWWNDLWLNEGFATFVGWLAVDHVFPEWDVWTQFCIEEFGNGLGLDALRSSHPIDVDVNSPKEVSQIFDAISYSKGASVIRMLNTFLGGSTFMDGVRSYLQVFKYKNTVTMDLWNHLAASSKQDVAKLMYGWTKEMGYPLVTVLDEKFDEGKGTCTVKLSQSRFVSGGGLKEEEDKVVWWVPVSVVTSQAPHKPEQHILNQKYDEITFAYKKVPGAFWKLNYGASGFFRVKYLNSQVEQISDLFRSDTNALPAADRVMFVSDAFLLSIAGIDSISNALNLVDALHKEENYIVLDQIASRLKHSISYWYQDDEIRAGLKVLFRKVFTQKVHDLGYEYTSGEDHLISMKRTLSISSALEAGDESVQKELFARFSDYLAGDKTRLHPNLDSSAYQAFLWESKEPSFALQTLLDLYKNASTSADQKVTILKSLGAVPSVERVQWILDEVMFDSEIVRPQDFVAVIAGIANANPYPQIVRPLLFSWMKKNWDRLYSQFKPSPMILGNIVKVCLSGRIGAEFVDEVNAWSQGVGLSEAEKKRRVEEVLVTGRSLEQSLEQIKTHTGWVVKESSFVREWINKH